MKHFGLVFLVAIGLGSCSSAMDYGTSISDREAFRIGKSVTPPKERTRLIEMLTQMKHDHHAQALNEIATR